MAKRRINFTKKKATVKGKHPTVWIPRPPFKKGGKWFIVVTTTTSGYYRDYLYEQVGER
jgi:hypothetical protein